MPKHPLPKIEIPEPRPIIDPYRDPQAFIRLLSELYHAERTALRWFEHLDDSTVVENVEILRGAKPMLVHDEQAHMDDIVEMIQMLGGDGILPASQDTGSFWDVADVRNVETWGTQLPLRASTVALFVLMSEALGYGVLYYLAETVVDHAIRERLKANVRDEERHVRVSMALLRKASRAEPNFWLNMTVYGSAYLMSARTVGRAQRRILSDVGLDYYQVTSASLQFARALLIDTFKDSPLCSASLRPFWDALARPVYSPLGMRLVHAAMYVPEPPGMWSAVRAFSNISRWGGAAR